MKVRMLISIAGLPVPRYGLTGIFAFQPGDEIDMHPELANAWILSGHAEPVSETKQSRGKKAF